MVRFLIGLLATTPALADGSAGLAFRAASQDRACATLPTTGAPPASYGADCDLAIDMTAGTVYGPKIGGVWMGAVRLAPVSAARAFAAGAERRVTDAARSARAAEKAAAEAAEQARAAAASAAETATKLDTALAGVVTPAMFGAVGDGLVDDTSAFAQFVAAVKRSGHGRCNAAAVHRLTGSVSLWHHAATTYEFCNLLIDFNAASWDAAALIRTHPTTPSQRAARLRWKNSKIRYSAHLTRPPIAFEDRYSSDIELDHVSFEQYAARRGTIIATSGVWNGTWSFVQVWGGGAHAPHKRMPPRVTVTMGQGGTTARASAAVFDAADVGRSLVVQGAFAEQFTIAAVVSPKEVVVSRPAAIAHLGQRAAFSGVVGSMTVGDARLVLSSAALTPEDVGRTVYVPQAGAAAPPRRALRARIREIVGATVILDRPALSTVSGEEVILSPAIDVYHEDANNDFYSDHLHIEQHAGVGLVVENCVVCTFARSKIHGFNNGDSFGATAFESLSAAFLRGQIDIDGDFEGMHVSAVGKTRFEGSMSRLRFRSFGIVVTGQCAINGRSNAPHAPLVVDQIDSAAPFDGADTVICTDGAGPTALAGARLVTGYNVAPAVGALMGPAARTQTARLNGAHAPCGSMATTQWVPITIPGQEGVFYIPACK